VSRIDVGSTIRAITRSQNVSSPTTVNPHPHLVWAFGERRRCQVF